MPDRPGSVQRPVALIGAPSSAGARQFGQEQAPKLFRSVGLASSLRRQGLRVLDLGDQEVIEYRPDRQSGRAQNLGQVVEVGRILAARVQDGVKQGAMPLVIGGDCTLTIGVLAGLATSIERLGLIYLDGDVDLNTPETTASGILDGMGVAHILGRGAVELARIGPRVPLVSEDRIALFGYQDEAMDPWEHELLAAAQVAKFPLAEVMRHPIKVAQEALTYVQDRSERYLVHFDVDVIRFDDLPVADVPHYRGMPLDSVMQCLEVFLGGAGLAGLVVTEFNAYRDPTWAASTRFVEALSARIGHALRADTADGQGGLA